MSNYNFVPTLDGLNNVDSNSINSNSVITDYLTVNLGSSVPTLGPSTNNNSIASTAFVQGAISSAAANYVDLTSTQVISGQKSFTNANTYISGNLKSDSASSNSVVLDDGTGNHYMSFNAKNMAFTTTESLSFSSGAYWTAYCENNYYFQKAGIGNNLFIQDNGGIGNGVMGLTVNNGTYNAVESFQELRLNTYNSKDIKLVSDKDIYLNPSSSGTTYISTITPGLSPIIIGSTSSTTQTATHNATTSFTKIPSCAVAPTSANHLCNYAYVNSVSGSPLASANVWTGTNTFNTNLPTSTISATTANQFVNKTTLDSAITSASILGTANAFTNTNTFTGTTSFQNNVTVQAGNTVRYGMFAAGGSGIDLGQTNTNEVTMKFVTAADQFIIRTLASGDLMTFDNTSITATFPFAMSNNFLINQSTYPSTSTTQIGYTITKTFGPSVLGDTTGTFTLVGSGQALGTNKGVYLITCGFELTNSGSDTVNNKALCLSLSSASGTPVNANGAWEYYEEINDAMGSGGTRFKGTLCGVYIKTTTSAQTLYLNGYANTSGSQTISATGNCSITRIG